MAPLLAVSGIMRRCDEHDFYIERLNGDPLLLDLPWRMIGQADDLLYGHVSLHGWFESSSLFAVYSIASAEG
jgi:hypothetical protein